MTPTAADHLTVTLNGAEILILRMHSTFELAKLKERVSIRPSTGSRQHWTAEKHDFKMTRLSSKLYKINN